MLSDLFLMDAKLPCAFHILRLDDSNTLSQVALEICSKRLAAKVESWNLTVLLRPSGSEEVLPHQMSSS